MFIISGSLIVVIIAMALFPFLFTNADPRECLLGRSLLRPSSEHWFGVDLQGCDYYARVVYGTRVSITIGLTVTIFATAIALIGGSISGYYGGIVILTLFGDRGVPQVSLVLIILG